MRRGEILTLRRDIDAALGARGLGPRGRARSAHQDRYAARIADHPAACGDPRMAAKRNRRQRLGVPVAGEPVGPGFHLGRARHRVPMGVSLTLPIHRRVGRNADPVGVEVVRLYVVVEAIYRQRRRRTRDRGSGSPARSARRWSAPPAGRSNSRRSGGTRLSAQWSRRARRSLRPPTEPTKETLLTTGVSLLLPSTL